VTKGFDNSAQECQASIISAEGKSALEEPTDTAEQDLVKYKIKVPAGGKMKAPVSDMIVVLPAAPDMMKAKIEEGLDMHETEARSAKGDAEECEGEDESSDVTSQGGTVELMKAETAGAASIDEVNSPVPEEKAPDVPSNASKTKHLAGASFIKVVYRENRMEGPSTNSSTEDIPASYPAEMEVDAVVTEGKPVEGKIECETSMDTAKETDVRMIAECQPGQVESETDSAEADIERDASTIIEDRDRGVETIAIEQTSKESNKQDVASTARIPLHRLMTDYNERKRTWEKVCRVQGSRKSARPKKAPDTFVAGPASYYPVPPAKRKVLRKMARRQTKLSRWLETQQMGMAPCVTETPPKARSCAGNSCLVKKAETESDLGQEDLDKGRKMNSSQPPCQIHEVSPPVASSASRTADTAPISVPKAAGDSSVPRSFVKRGPGVNCPIQNSIFNEGKANSPPIFNTPQERSLAAACMGKRFPEQLMLLVTSKVVGERLWWTPDKAGNTFAFDVAYFRDDVMNRFFPPNHYRRMTLTLKRWYEVDLLKVCLLKTIEKH
jgi:hypothetical protein